MTPRMVRIDGVNTPPNVPGPWSQIGRERTGVPAPRLRYVDLCCSLGWA
jgi:hypothetical protein